MIYGLIRKAGLLATAAFVVHLLVRQFGTGTALVAWAVGSLLACVTGAMLLRTSVVGRITWKNWLAAWLMPWGVRLCGGRLWPIPVTSWAVWVTVAVVVAVLTPVGAESDSWPPIWRVALGTAWVIDGGALLYLAGTLRQSYSPNWSGGRTLVRIAAAVTGLIAASALLYWCGLPYLAVAVAGGPPLVLGLGYGLFLGAILAFSNGRWN